MAYNGWTNWETWNASLWILNDEGLCSIAQECRDYAEFVERMRELGSIETPDQMAWNDSGINVEEMNAIEDLWRGGRNG